MTGTHQLLVSGQRYATPAFLTAWSLPLARVTELKPATVAWLCRCRGQAEQGGSGRTSQRC